MKILNTKLARQAIAAALVLSAAAAMSVGAFAAEGEADTAALTEDVTVAGYLPRRMRAPWSKATSPFTAPMWP